jgi:tetratricopeptide (TPR) repeat protein
VNNPDLERLSRAVEADPDDGEAWFRLGRYLLDETNNAKAAARAFEQANAKLPDQDLRLFLGKAYFEAGETQKGLGLLRQHVHERPTAAGMCMLANALMKVNESAETERWLKDALRLDPDFEEPYYLMGEFLAEKFPDQAVHFYREAIKRDPDYQMAWRDLGALLLRDPATLNQALESLKRAVALSPEDPWAAAFLGKAYWKNGQMDEAEGSYARAIELEPDDPLFLDWYIQCAASRRIA